jgi:hypothetical protein
MDDRGRTIQQEKMRFELENLTRQSINEIDGSSTSMKPEFIREMGSL